MPILEIAIGQAFFGPGFLNMGHMLGVIAEQTPTPA
jgi:hypothetical protein